MFFCVIKLFKIKHPQYIMTCKIIITVNFYLCSTLQFTEQNLKEKNNQIFLEELLNSKTYPFHYYEKNRTSFSTFKSFFYAFTGRFPLTVL